MPLRISKIQAADIPDVARLNGVVQDLHATMHPDIFRADWEPRDFEAFWLKRLDDPASAVAVAALDGRAVGYIWFEVQDRPQDARHWRRRCIYVHQIGVDEDARRMGVGARLLEHAEVEARRLGITAVGLDAWAANAAAQAFFRSQGYDPQRVVLSKTVWPR